MPIFEYRCATCGERFEILVARADEIAPRCPRCDAANVEKLLSSFSVARAPAAGPGPCGSTDCACRRS